MSSMEMDFPGAPIPPPQPRIYRGVGVTSLSLILRLIQMVLIAISAICFWSVYPSLKMEGNSRILCVVAVYALCIWSIITVISSMIGLRWKLRIKKGHLVGALVLIDICMSGFAYSFGSRMSGQLLTLDVASMGEQDQLIGVSASMAFGNAIFTFFNCIDSLYSEMMQRGGNRAD
nr:hypothetical protein Itr_chr04CG12680 [Ipomoea trifida]